jgi:Domain of unknown function (DUF4279)
MKTEFLILPESHPIICVNTCLMICGENLDFNDISHKLNLSPKMARLYSKLVTTPILPSIANGADRDYDSRFSKGYWRLMLTSKQSEFNLVQQLEFWIEKLYPVRSSFEQFKDLGYWSVIDCQIASRNPQLPSIQFQLPKELQLKLCQISIDIDFTVYRPVTEM